MAELSVIDVNNTFLRDISFRVPKGGFFSIVGPSGAGKTSLLRVIAGLARHEGRILMGGEEIQASPPSHRAVGWVSQDIYLFPHLTIEGNLLLAMKRTRQPANIKRRKAKEMLDLLKIGGLGGRKPTTLSGGEKQRAALARVLVSDPALLLLDEPFSKLDFRTARHLRSEFKNLQKKLGLTTIIVTHNLSEAYGFSTELGVMNDGCLEVARNRHSIRKECMTNGFLETLNLIPCRPEKKLDYGLVQLSWAGGKILFPNDCRPWSKLAVKQSDVLIGPEPPPGPDINRFSGLVGNIDVQDDSVHLVIDVNGFKLYAEVSMEHWRERTIAAGQRIYGLLRMNVLEAVE